MSSITQQTAIYLPPRAPAHILKRNEILAGYEVRGNGTFQCFMTFFSSSQDFLRPARRVNGKASSSHRSHDFFCLFLARTFGAPHTGGRDTLVLSCPQCLRGVTWVRIAFFFSSSRSFPISNQSFLLTHSCFSSQIYLVTDRSDDSIEFHFMIETNGHAVLPPHHISCII